MSAQPMLPGVVGAVLARGVDWMGSPRARAGVRAGIWRSAFDLADAEDLCSRARWVAEAQARAEAEGRVFPAQEIAELRALLREVSVRVQWLREVLGG